MKAAGIRRATGVTALGVRARLGQRRQPRDLLLGAYRPAWGVARVGLRRASAQRLHDGLIGLLRRVDELPPLLACAGAVHAVAMPPRPTLVGGVTLPWPVIVAAGLVKGDGFPEEAVALAAVDGGRDVIPGWRSVPALLGAVEFGSFTRYPRTGNPGTVIWRDESTRSTQNRVGLRNPGARAAAAFLGAHAPDLPPVYGINLAVSPGVAGDARAAAEIGEAAELFEAALRAPGHGPAWYTLNLSCPNTGDDPRAQQTEARARVLVGTLVGAVAAPVWVKLSPGLARRQYEVLVEALAGTGARAVVATNTLSKLAPDGSSAEAGLGGNGLRPHALGAIRELARAIAASGVELDIVACGGIMTRRHLEAARAAGASAVMVYSALVFRGPLAPALIGP